MTIVLTRHTEDDYQTLGTLEVWNPEDGSIIFKCKTLELPWRNNERRVSRIPSNHYPAVKHQSPKFGNSVWIQNVDNRSEILIHRGNYHRDTLGCILVGKEYYDIDGDGHLDVTDSVNTMNRLYNILPDNLYVNIIEEWKE